MDAIYLSKKGQITVFIIIGILLLMVLGIFAYISFMTGDTGSRQEATTLPLQEEGIKTYVEACLQKTARDGIELIGMQGGYYKTDRFSSNYIKPTEGESLEFFPQSNITIPYWVYLASKNNDPYYILQTNTPTLRSSDGDPSVEKELEAYIDANLGSCINDFTAFRQQGMNIEYGAPVSDVIIAEENILVGLRYKVQFKSKDATFTMERFSTELNLNLKKLYGQMLNLVELEIREGYLERNTINLIVGFSGLSEDKLPPISAADYEKGRKYYWTKADVREKIKYMLASYIPIIKVAGALNFESAVFNSSIRQGLYDQMILPSDLNYTYNESVPYVIEFTYLPLWEPYVDVTGRGVTSSKVGPESLDAPLIDFMSVNYYQLYYEVSYPVVIELYDPVAFNYEGYHFRVALEANLRDNKPINMTGKLPSLGSGSMLCQENQRNSGNISVAVRDYDTGELIPNATIYYSCGFRACDIGTSARASFIANFPVCQNGLVYADKRGYYGNKEPFTTSAGQRGSVEVYLRQKHRVNVTVEKFYSWYALNRWNVAPNPAPLDESAYVMFTIERKKDSPADEEFIAMGFINSSNPAVEIDMISGAYTITAFHNLRQSVVIEPHDAICYREHWYDTSDTCIWPDMIFFNQTFPQGGVLLDNSSREYFIQKNALANANTLKLFVISIPDDPEFVDPNRLLTFPARYGPLCPGCVVGNIDFNDYSKLVGVEEMSRKYRSQLEPVLS